MNIEFIEQLIELAARHGLRRLEYNHEGERVCFESQAAPGAALTRNDAPTADGAALSDDTAVVLKSPLMGLFYRAPAPDKPAYVEVGDKVEEGQTLAIVEAMKMLNPIVAERSGIVVDILCEDGKSVEFDAPLFLIQEHAR